MMNEHAQDSYPLTVAQRGLWLTQKISPGANLNIAEAIEICGPIKPEIFRRALHQLAAEAEQLRVRVVEKEGMPRQIPWPNYGGNFPYVDMSDEEDPRKTIHDWMTHDVMQPVDLAKGPLWGSALLKASDDSYFWYQRAHHIVYDGYGGGLVARRLAELYTAYARGNEPEPNCFCTVEAMLEAESSYRNSDRFRRDREYWHEQLAQLPEAVTLSRRNRRHGLSGELLRSVGYLPAATARQLGEFGKGAGASLPQVLIALIASYYQRVTGVPDLVFGMPVSGRVNGALRNSVSVSANVVPLRASFTPGMTAVEAIAQVSRTVRQALRHQQYRFEDMRRDLGLVGQGQNVAWLGVNIEPFDYQLSFDGASTHSHNVSNSSAEDLMVFVYDRGTNVDLRFDLDANPSLYEIAELDEHRRRLLRFIDQVLEHPGAPLAELDILGEEERRRLVFEWNDTREQVPAISLAGLVAKWAAETPDAAAVEFGKVTVSYRELHEHSLRQARQLIAHGVKPGQIVAVALPRNERLLSVLLAILRTGAAYLPLDLDSPPERLAMVLEDAAPTVVIAEPETHARFADAGFTILQPKDLDVLRGESLHVPDLSTADGTAYVIYTSGSTGHPKGVEVTHRNLSNFLYGMQRLLKPTPRDKFLAVTTIIFDIAGLELYLPLTVGTRVVMAGSEAVRNAPELARLIRRSGVTHVQATPSLWRILLSSPETKLENVHVLVGGEALSADLAANLKRMAARVTQFYGPTETTIWSTAFELLDVGAASPPIGRPIVNTQLYVLGEDRQPVVMGALGELYIGGAGVAKGYLNRPELTAERFLENPFTGDGSRMYRTGDLVRWNEGGQLEFIGRADEQVKINGQRIELGEIESALREHPMVAEAAVAAHRNPDHTTTLIAYLVPRAGSSIEISALRIALAGRLPSSMMPSRFTPLDALPLTPNGKLDRKALPIPERAGRKCYVEPVTAMEKKLATLWQQILNVEEIGLHDNFFELGGDSLSAAVMGASCGLHLGVELPVGSLFEAPTIADLAGVVERLTGESLDPLNVMLPLRKVRNAAPRPLFCIHPMAGISLGFSSLLRHLDPALPIYGLQSRALRQVEAMPSSIEEIAADYLSEIRKIQPSGPYRLMGRSLGGLIGHSIAEQMQVEGEEVEFLAMIDSYLFISGQLAGLRSEADEVRAALSFLNAPVCDGQMPQTLQELATVLVQTYDPRSVPLLQEIFKGNPQFIQNLCAVMIKHLELARKFVPGTIDLDLLFFQATEYDGNLEGILDHSPYAWRPFVGGRIEVHELACHHEEVLDPEPAAKIGHALQQLLFTADLQVIPVSSSALRSRIGEGSLA
ncbi:MAG TPA: amino acid adenylation domain-containing protein [Acidobacteriaceae bacterium]|nr:amino acid adenylation domain-containing protein [Acidobacteriaceae bacterium]